MPLVTSTCPRPHAVPILPSSSEFLAIFYARVQNKIYCYEHDIFELFFSVACFLGSRLSVLKLEILSFPFSHYVILPSHYHTLPHLMAPTEYFLLQDFLDDDVQYNFVRHFYTHRDQVIYLVLACCILDHAFAGIFLLLPNPSFTLLSLCMLHSLTFQLKICS